MDYKEKIELIKIAGELTGVTEILKLYPLDNESIMRIVKTLEKIEKELEEIIFENKQENKNEIT